MSDVFAEARVRIVPDTTGFKQKLDTQLSTAMRSSTASTQGLKSATAGAANEQNRLQKEAGKSKAALLGLGTASGRLDAALLGLRTAVGSTAVIGLGAGALAAIALGKALRQAITDTAAFEQELNTFQAVTQASAEQMAAVSNAAQALGADITLPAVSAADAAVAMTELGKAGLSVQDSIAGARGVLQLATAAQIDNAAAAQLAANALNAFGLGGDQAVRVADDLANAANAAQGSIGDFGLALAQSSAVARQVGLSLEDTTAILSLFAKNGLQGSDAGTSLRVALIRLIAPSKEAAAEIQKLGIHLRNAQGNLRPDVFAQFGEATRDLSPAMRDAAAALIFGQDAIRAVSIGAREGADGLRLMQFQIEQQGTAAEVAQARTKGLAGEFGALQSNLQTLGIQFGSLLSLGLTPLLDAINSGLSDVNKFAEALKKLDGIKIPPIHIPLVVDFPGANVPGGGIAKTVGSFIKGRLEGAIPFGGAVQATNVVKDITKALGILGDGSDKTKDKLSRLNAELQNLEKARTAAETGAQAAGTRSVIADQLTKQIDAIKKQIKDLEQTGKGIDESVTGPLKRARDLLIQTRNIKLAGNADADVSRLNTQIQSLNIQINTYTRAARMGLGSSEDLRGGFTQIDRAARQAAGGVDHLTTSIKALNASQVEGQLQAQKTAVARAQAFGGTGLVELQKELDRIDRILASAKAPKGPALEALFAERRAVIDQINAINKESADKIKEAATKAAKQQADATKAFIDNFGASRQAALNRAKLAAALTEGGQDDKRVDIALRKFLKTKLEAIRNRIRTLHLHGQALKTARDAIKTINAQIDDLNNQIAQDIQNINQQRLERFDLRIQIAEDRGNTKAILRAHRAKLAEITRQLVAARKQYGRNSLEWLRLKAAQADEIKAIKELENQTKKRNTAIQSMEFTFLQTQSGFAANLLGNLIPGMSTAGLVGGTTSVTGGTPPNLPPGTTGILPQEHGRGQSPGDKVRSASATAAGAPTRGGQATQTHILQQIRHLLDLIYRGTGHPEAKHRQSRNLREMDLADHH